jgi:hypothetical protein
VPYVLSRLAGTFRRVDTDVVDVSAERLELIANAPISLGGAAC